MTRTTDNPNSRGPEDAQWYEDDELWLSLIKALDDDQIDHAARLFHRLAKDLEQGSDGAYRVRCCLENALRLAFPYTRFAGDAKVLFIESLNEPGSLPREQDAFLQA